MNNNHQEDSFYDNFTIDQLIRLQKISKEYYQKANFKENREWFDYEVKQLGRLIYSRKNLEAKNG